jgi:Helix-turn-helix domain
MMTDNNAADRLAQAIRDLINEAVAATVMTPSRHPPPRHEAPTPKPEQISDEARRTYADAEQPVQRLLTVAEARERLGGIGASMFYKLVTDGQIQTTKIGRRTFVAASVLDRFFDSH